MNNSTASTPSRTAFLAARKSGIGGSDVAALYNLDYSCRRRLWYDKTNAVPDFPREETKAMRLGSYMEDYFADEFAEQSGRAVLKLHEPITSGGVLRVNVDRMEADAGHEGPGVVEIKSMGREMFYRTKREGLSKSYILQLQAGMIAAGASWGTFVVGSRDSGDILYFDVDRNEELCKSIVLDSELFWVTVQNGPIPDALEPEDRRCQKCEFRVTCQGNAWGLPELQQGDLVPAPELIPLITEKLERDALYDQALDLCNETDEELKAALGDRQAVIAGGVKVYHRPQAGKTLYRGKELLEAYRKLMTWAGEVGLGYREPDSESLRAIAPPPESFVSTSKPSRPLRLFGGK